MQRTRSVWYERVFQHEWRPTVIGILVCDDDLCGLCGFLIRLLFGDFVINDVIIEVVSVMKRPGVIKLPFPKKTKTPNSKYKLHQIRVP